MTQPVTWDQIIDAAADNGGKVGGPGQQVRGLRRVDQRAHRRAPAATSSPTPSRAPTPRSTSAPKPAPRRQRSSRSWRTRRRAARPLGVQRGHRARPVRDGQWWLPGQLDVHLPQLRRRRGDAGQTSAGPDYPETVEGEDVRAARSAASTSASARTPRNEPRPSRPRSASRQPDNQVQYAVETGNMPARPAAYDDAGAAGAVPRRSARAVPRPASTPPGRGRRRRTGRRSPTRSSASGTRPTRSTRTRPPRLGDVHRPGPPRRSVALRRRTDDDDHGARRRRSRQGRTTRVSDRTRAENRLGWKLVAPAVVMMLLVTAYPMFKALYLSLFQYRLTAPDDREFIGLQQLRDRAHRHAVVAGRRGTPCSSWS